MKKAVIAGATGLIGGELLNIILENTDYHEVLVLTRRELPIQHHKLAQLIVDFDLLSQYSQAIQGHAMFCCLGSTRKKTPDINDYRKVDYTYPLELARIAKQNQVDQYHLVSALGANANSTNFYSRLKGETEAALTDLHLPCLHIYQPSLLTGSRKEVRPLESVAVMFFKFLNVLLIGGLKKYRSIPATTVARAMYNQSLKPGNGLFIHPSDHIIKLA